MHPRPSIPRLRSWFLLLRRQGLLATLLGGTVLLPLAGPVRATVLYKLDTFCSIDGAAAVPCQVEAIDEAQATIYRHTIGTKEWKVRITDRPQVRMEIWNATANRWESALSAAAIFSKNIVCFNGKAFCVVNPNYLNSVREDRGPALSGRDLLEVSFGRDGRINAYCYDDGCPDQQSTLPKK